VTLFVEHALLPAVNRLPPLKAHNFNHALDALLASNGGGDDGDNVPGSSTAAAASSAASSGGSAGKAQFGCPRALAVCAASAVRRAIDQRGGLHRCGEDFRVHPKGTGVVVDAAEGLAAHTFVNEYIGELYPPWRW
jgi:hypothetical protein